MALEKKYVPLLVANAAALIGFTAYYLMGGNYEFLVYISVIVFFLAVIYFTRDKVDYPIPILWGLSFWAIMHMAGGTFYIGDTRLYDFIFVPLVGEPYNVLRFDQLIHAFGFGVTTFVAFYLLRPLLKSSAQGSMTIAILLTMVGLGAGGVNEILEFITTILSPDTGVGGYINNAVDLVSNVTGAAIAATYIYHRADRM